MARREIPEINAGSMADIAFLLLIFWLVTTTIDSDEGVKRQLPPPVPPDMEQQEVKDGDVYNVRTNFRDELLVEKEVMSISQLKDGAKDFLIAPDSRFLFFLNLLISSNLDWRLEALPQRFVEGKPNGWT